MRGAYYMAAGVSRYLGGVVTSFASVPLEITEPLQTLPIYTSLFNRLGIAALVCALIAIAVLPLMKGLYATQGAEAAIKRSASAGGTPTIAAEGQSG